MNSFNMVNVGPGYSFSKTANLERKPLVLMLMGVFGCMKRSVGLYD